VALVVQGSGWGGMGGARRLLRRPPAGHRHCGDAVQSGTAQRRPRCRACLHPQGSLRWGTMEGCRRPMRSGDLRPSHHRR
jgi:hypothetical protein